MEHKKISSLLNQSSDSICDNKMEHCQWSIK